MTTAEAVLPAAAQLGECPLWSVSEQCLYWIDIDGRAVHRYDPATGHDQLMTVAGRPGSIALTAEPGRLLLAIEHRLVFLDWEGGDEAEWMRLEPPGTGNRLNDGRADRAGRFWVGSMYADTSAGRFTGMLHGVGPGGTTNTVRSEVGVANGLAFSPDGAVMFFADTLRDTVWAYDYDLETGVPRDPQVFLDFSDLPGRPDGACVDEDGCYWIACVYGWAVLRVTPGGAVDRRLDVPVQKPTMPAFGGPDLATLYLTSIGGGGSHDVDPSEPGAGRLLAIEGLGARGLAEPAFAG